ncbi:hypothetical protein CHUAL_000508 [Chamberlinius hualienensis]
MHDVLWVAPMEPKSVRIYCLAEVTTLKRLDVDGQPHSVKCVKALALMDFRLQAAIINVQRSLIALVLHDK